MPSNIFDYAKSRGLHISSSLLVEFFEAAEDVMQFEEGDIAPKIKRYDELREKVYEGLGKVTPKSKAGTPTDWANL